MPKTYDEFDKNHIFPFHFYPDQQKPEEVPPVPLYLMNEHARVPVRGRRSEPYVIQDQVNASREWFHATLQVRREQSLSHLHCPVVRFSFEFLSCSLYPFFFTFMHCPFPPYNL